MKRFLAMLLAALTLLSCVTALAESADAPYFIKEMGLSFDLNQLDIYGKIDNVLSLSIGGVDSHEPYCCYMPVRYIAMDRGALEAKNAEVQAAGDSQKQMELAREIQTLIVDIGEIAVTQLATPKEYLDFVGWNADDIPGITEFAALDGYHWYFVTLPVDDIVAYYDEIHAFGDDGEEAEAALEKVRSEIGLIYANLLKYLENTGHVAPVDPDSEQIGKVIRFETTDLDGNPVKSEDLFGDNRITMINVWGSWCPNCVNEMAELAEMHTRLRAKGCGIVGVEFEREPIEKVEQAARAVMAANGTNYPNVLKPENVEAFNSIMGYPTTFFVDSEGTVLTFSIAGAAVDEYERVIDQLLAGEVVDVIPGSGATANGDNKYRVFIFDGAGNPVEGAVVQFCDDVTCSFQSTDADGMAAFPVGEQKIYEVHLLKVPEGYKADTTVYYTPDTYSDVNIFLEKAE